MELPFISCIHGMRNCSHPNSMQVTDKQFGPTTTPKHPSFCVLFLAPDTWPLPFEASSFPYCLNIGISPAIRPCFSVSHVITASTGLHRRQPPQRLQGCVLEEPVHLQHHGPLLQDQPGLPSGRGCFRVSIAIEYL